MVAMSPKCNCCTAAFFVSSMFGHMLGAFYAREEIRGSADHPVVQTTS
jgi:hypothetical protein